MDRSPMVVPTHCLALNTTIFTAWHPPTTTQPPSAGGFGPSDTKCRGSRDKVEAAKAAMTNATQKERNVFERKLIDGIKAEARGIKKQRCNKLFVDDNEISHVVHLYLKQ